MGLANSGCRVPFPIRRTYSLSLLAFGWKAVYLQSYGWFSKHMEYSSRL